AVLVPRAHAALRDGDLDAFAAATTLSQQLAETHLRNQVPQTVELVRSAARLGARTASAFGAGFGGSVWALVPTADADGFAAEWRRRYRRPARAPGAAATPVPPPRGPGRPLWPLRPSAGAAPPPRAGRARPRRGTRAPPPRRAAPAAARPGRSRHRGR